MSSFDDADRRAKYSVVPKSVNDGKVVKLEPKKLKTERMVRTVLPEEKYVSDLEKIIQRDYFPELPKLKAQNEFLAAQERNDIAKMRELQLQFKTQRRTERRTSPGKARFAPSPMPGVAPSPAVFDPETPGPSRADKDPNEMTPMPGVNPEGDNEIEKKKSEIDDLTVDTYLNKYTSEDNASFEELSSLMAERHRNKISWLYDAADKHNKEMVTRAVLPTSADEQLALRYDVEADKNKPKALDNWAYTAQSHVLFHQDEAPLTEAEKLERAKLNQRVINKNATRFPANLKIQPSESSMARAAFSQAAQMAGKVDATGKELGVVRAKTLGLVATPSPAPGVDDTPFMTWGEIDGTPFRLDAADVDIAPTAAPAFKMPALPARETIAQSMADTIGKIYREKRRTAAQLFERAHKSPRMGSPSSSAAISNLSPAARLLMKNKLGIRMGSKTPLSNVSPLTKSPMLRTSVGVRGVTPSSSSYPSALTPSSSITDNLLSISFPSPIAKKEEEAGEQSAPSNDKKRPTAGDFF